MPSFFYYLLDSGWAIIYAPPVAPEVRGIPVILVDYLEIVLVAYPPSADEAESSKLAFHSITFIFFVSLLACSQCLQWQSLPCVYILIFFIHFPAFYSKHTLV